MGTDQVTQSAEVVTNLVWRFGIGAFRLSRKAHLSSFLAPAFVRMAALVPPPRNDVVATLANGATLRMPAAYRDARTVATGLFQADETKLFERLIHPGMTFVDVGAYVGYFSVLATTLVGPAGKVYALEPDPTAFEFLQGNLEVNHCINAVAINKAAWDADAPARLVRDPRGPESFVLVDGVNPTSTLIETVSLDSLFEAMGWPAADIVKMNIEGGELRALRGMQQISQRNPSLLLVMEFNPDAMTRSGISRADLNSTLVNLGFHRGHIIERNLQLIRNGELLPGERAVYNVLLSK